MNGNKFRTNLYALLRDLHLYLGLFFAPFVLVFAASVFFLVHAWLPTSTGKQGTAGPRVVSDLPVPTGLSDLSGRHLIDALRPCLAKAGVDGEVGWVQKDVNENRLVLPVSVPGRLTTVTIDIAKHQAAVEEHSMGLADAVVTLHKSPGPHLAGVRKNWIYMRFWSWLADATVYGLVFISASGVYLWYALRSERLVGTWLLALGAISFFCIVYALSY